MALKYLVWMNTGFWIHSISVFFSDKNNHFKMDSFFFLVALKKDREDGDGDCDVKFIFPHEPEVQPLQAHKFVLKTVSKVFKADFCGPLSR